MSKTTTGHLLTGALLAALLTACSGDKPSENSPTQAPATASQSSLAQTPTTSSTNNTATNPVSETTAVSANSSNLPHGGKVLRAMYAGGYTYMKLEDNEGRQFWVAASMMNVKHNDHITWDSAALQTNFHSGSLHRHFDEILFVTSARNEH